MKIQDIFKGKKEEINLEVIPSIEAEIFDKIQNNKEVTITSSQDAYWLICNQERIEIEGKTAEDKKLLDRITNSNTVSYVCDLSNKKAQIKSKLFVNVVHTTEEFELGLTDIIIDDINKRFSRKRQQQKHIDWLSDELIIQGTTQTQILIDNSPKDKGFRVFGKSIVVDVKKNEEDKLEINRILKWNNHFNPTHLLRGNVSIKDISKTATLRQETELQLKKIDSTERYINTWEKYQAKEQEYNKKEVEKLGFLVINNSTKKSEKRYELTFEKNKNTDNWLSIEVGSYIDLNKTLEFPTFDSYEKGNKNIICKIIEKHNNHLLVETEDEGIPTDTLFYASLSLLGNVIMNRRRSKALQEVRNNSTPMPVLSAVLEGIDYNSATHRKIKLTSKVKKEFGEYGPNEMQEEALDIALNTPDIAIIQGPPGTGKTKVISALTKRLTEVYKDNGEAPEMNILLTAFQHDAVDNMVARTEVLGLPTIKFSKNKKQSIDVIDKWIINQTEKIEAKQSEIQPNEFELTYNEILSSYIEYIKSLNQEKAKDYLAKIRKENLVDLPDEISEEITNLIKKEFNVDKELLNRIIDILRNIRTNEISYSDDGEINLRRFIKNYDSYQDDLPTLNQEAINKIRNFKFTDNLTDKDWKELETTKLELLDNLQSTHIDETIHLPNPSIERVYKELLGFYSQKIKSEGSIYSVLSEFQNDLGSNKERVKETIQNYVALAATTVQGSKGKRMLNLKSDPFDTVIVDEAARANPLDLLIPLTSAKRRIILVGDHRQLSHIVDNAIQKELEEDENSAKDVTNFLENSLFERFYVILKKLQEKDGVQRVTTLNTQYRMHPAIGDFVSKTFYEKYGDPKINSGTPAEKLIHGIAKYGNNVAVSVNIPSIKGGEKKDNGSIYRPVEAQEAIRRAKEILDSDPSISVGVITFYSRQVTELFNVAIKENMAEKDEQNNEPLISKKYQKNIKGEERFRIGSVDAFQGKEFDVVILCLVRSNNLQIKSEKDIRRKYGFLTSYNRLNVAMSRAKKLLITIGDKEMFKNEKAKEKVFGLYAFYNELIQSDYGVSI